MNKIHLFDYEENEKVPEWEENKQNGYKVAVCGYQRKVVTTNEEHVNCKHCLRVMNK